MLDKVNNNLPTNIQLDTSLKKGGIKEAVQTPQDRQISNVFNRCLGYIKTFSSKLQENQDCHDHSVGMRRSAGKIKKLVQPFFQKIKEIAQEQTDKLGNSRVVRKLKNMLETLETYDFNFVRSSESPILIDAMAQSLTELLEQYADFERRNSTLDDEEHHSEIGKLLASIGKLPFKEDKFHVRNAMVGEVLTKYLAQRSLNETDHLVIPCLRGLEPCMISYGPVARMSLGESGIPVLVYAPLEKGDRSTFSPLLLFRGTRMNFTNAVDIRSVLENLHKVGPARHIYDQFRGALQQFLVQWFKEAGANTPHFRILGFSQGAVLGQRALVDFYPYCERRLYQESLLFNSPALEEDYFSTWEQIPTEEKPQVIIYLVTHDVVSKRGYRFASDQIYEIKPRQPKKWLGAHLGSKFVDPEWEVFQVDNFKESESPSRKLVNQVCASSSVEMIYKSLAHRFRSAKSDATKRPSRESRQTRRMS